MVGGILFPISAGMDDNGSGLPRRSLLLAIALSAEEGFAPANGHLPKILRWGGGHPDDLTFHSQACYM